MTDKKPGSDEKPQQTVITKEKWEARQFAAHLLGEDMGTELLPTATSRNPGKVTVCNPFNIPEAALVIDAAMGPKTISVMQNITELLAAYPACNEPDHDALAPNELALGGCSNPNCLKFKGHIFVKRER